MRKILLIIFVVNCSISFAQFNETAPWMDEVEKKQIREEVRLKAGMAEDIDKYIKMSAEEFEVGLKKLQKANITPENAMKYLDEALIYFNPSLPHESLRVAFSFKN